MPFTNLWCQSIFCCRLINGGWNAFSPLALPYFSQVYVCIKTASTKQVVPGYTITITHLRRGTDGLARSLPPAAPPWSYWAHRPAVGLRVSNLLVVSQWSSYHRTWRLGSPWKAPSGAVQWGCRRRAGEGAPPPELPGSAVSGEQKVY